MKPNDAAFKVNRGENKKMQVSVVNTVHPGKSDSKNMQTMLLNLFLVPKYFKKLHHTPLAKKMGIMPDEKHLLQLWQASLLYLLWGVFGAIFLGAGYGVNGVMGFRILGFFFWVWPLLFCLIMFS